MSDPPGREGSDEPLTRVRSLVETGALVVAPTALLTALLFYFGWVRARAQYRRFGIDQSILGFSSSDYVFRSIGSVFWALVVLLVAGLIAVAVAAFTAGLVRRRDVKKLRALGVGLSACGIVVLIVGAVAMRSPPDFWERLVFAPLCLCIAIPTIAWGAHVVLESAELGRPERRSRSRARRTASAALVSFLVVVFAFWAVGDWAAVRGTRMGRILARQVEYLPSVVVLSERRLHITARCVTETELAGGEGGYRYRYSRLRLLVRSGGKYFLLPAAWNRKTGTTIVLPDAEGYRFAFSVGRPLDRSLPCLDEA